jgi:hypothetical protein
MANISITGIDKDMAMLSRELERGLQQLAEQVKQLAQANTPIKTGRARGAWTKKTSKEDFEVSNRVPYIQRLEAGASRQAPKGIIGPTLAQIKGKSK